MIKFPIIADYTDGHLFNISIWYIYVNLKYVDLKFNANLSVMINRPLGIQLKITFNINVFSNALPHEFVASNLFNFPLSSSPSSVWCLYCLKDGNK